MSYFIEISGLSCSFRVGPSTIHALKRIDLFVTEGEFIAIMGPSGSGKSTLLHIIGCLERPTLGTYILNGKDLSRATDRELSHIRANKIGFVFQTFNLIPQLTVFENVELPFLYSSSGDNRTKERVNRAIEQVGLGDRVHHRPAELSGGEIQRVAIARALAIEPAIILVDEPTGNLDSTTSSEILWLFQNLHDQGSTILMVTHDREVASGGQRLLTLKDGTFV